MKKRVSFPSNICPVFLRSKRIFRQYLKSHAFSILVTQLTGFYMSRKNTEAWNFSRALTQNGLNILVIISIAKALPMKGNKSNNLESK